MSGFDINHTTITGNLTADPELRTLPSGQAVCKIRIAHNDRRKNASGEWTDYPGYYDVTIWAGMGEWIAANVTKGQKVVVDGRLNWREWEVDGGAKRSAIDITANSVVPVPRNGNAAPAEEFAAVGASDEEIPF